MKRWLTKNSRTIISVALILGPAMALGFRGRSIEMGVAVLAGGVSALFINLDRFKRIKVSPTGFEGDLKKVIDEAYATVETLRRVARTLLLTTLYSLNRASRGTDDSEKHEMRDELDALARDLRIQDDKDILAANEAFYRLHTWDRFSRFCRTFKHNPVVQNELTKLINYGSAEFPDDAAIAHACRYLGEHPLNPEQAAARDEYLRYRTERTATPNSAPAGAG